LKLTDTKHRAASLRLLLAVPPPQLADVICMIRYIRYDAIYGALQIRLD